MLKKNQLSPNFSKKPRVIKDIKFVIYHYTGMQSEIESIKRLKNAKSKVSCHYFIKRNGEVIQMVKDLHVAWHAGKSKWKTFKNLNLNSIGIELANKGHEFGYQNFSSQQIKSLIHLSKSLKKKYRIKKENFLGHSDIAPLRKNDPGEKFPWKKLSRYKIGIWFSKKNNLLTFQNKKKIQKKFFDNLQKIGYRYIKNDTSTKRMERITRSFQQHFLPGNISGVVDQKTFEISCFLANSVKTS